MIVTTVPVSAFVSANPAVVGAGGAAVALNGLFLTTSWRVPIGQVLSFPTAAGVSAYFGGSSTEAAHAAIYFQGFTGSNVKPGALLFAQYNTIAVPAYLRGGNVSSLTVAQLEALSGVLKVTVNGTVYTSSSINLSSSGTFSVAAATIQTGFSTFAGTIVYDSVSGAFLFTTTATGATETISTAISGTGTASACTTSSTVLTVGGTVTGKFNVGDTVIGTDTTNSVNALIVNQLTGTAGGAGTYTISAAATPGNMTSAAVAAYGVTGAFAVGLGLTAPTGAVLSQGADIAVPAVAMNAIYATSNNWYTFTTLFNPDASGNTNKLALAAWTTLQNYQVMYVAWDSDITPTASSSATSSLGYLLKADSYSGTAALYEPSDLSGAAFICGAVASIDFTENQGNTDLAFRSQGGLQPGVTNQTVLANLESNGYNCYLISSKGNEFFTFLYPGTVSGPFLSIRRFANQMWLNASFQFSLMSLLTTIKALPYNKAGYGLIEASMMNVILQALKFGAIQPGVVLSSSEIAEVNYAAGEAIAGTLQSVGWYLQVKDPGAIVRQAGGSPNITFWYTDGGSVLQLNFASVDVI